LEQCLAAPRVAKRFEYKSKFNASSAAARGDGNEDAHAHAHGDEHDDEDGCSTFRRARSSKIAV
jgi:hypothetical protein